MATDAIRRDYRARTGENRNAVPAGVADAPLADFLQALARAVRQLRTYPASSPLCVDAIDACQRAFSALDPPSPLTVRVTARDLIVGDVEVGRGTVVEQELARLLHRARVAALEIDRGVSPRDWSRFCADVLRLQRMTASKVTLAELLADGGVATIRARTTPRPEVLDVGAPPAPVRDLVERERTRRAAAASGAPPQYFYPPDKGWVRFDPATPLDTLSLVDLAVVVDDPSELAAVLMRLTDDDTGDPVERETAIEQKYGDVVTLLSALDPRLARVLLSKLARAVLRLDPERRRTLLRRTILPGLLDGRADAEVVLTEFPDVDLADALCLLLDLETAAPEVLSAALDRLALPPDRRASLVPMIREKLAAGAREPAGRRALDSYTGRLVQVAPEGGKSFVDFAAFDLAITAATESALDGVRGAIRASDDTAARLACLLDLICLDANPESVVALLQFAVVTLRRLVDAGRWGDFAGWMARFGAAAAAIADARPDTADAIRTAVGRLVDRDLIVAIAARCERSTADRRQAEAIVDALGPAVVAAWVAALDRQADHVRVRPLAAIIGDRAAALAPALAAHLPAAGTAAARAIVAALGAAGRHYESAVAAQIGRGDEALAREALRALARIGSREAAALVGRHLVAGAPATRVAAEEALSRFPPQIAAAVTRDLLADRAFVLRDPQAALRLLDRAARTHDVDLKPVVAHLMPLRFRFWNPALMRIAARAKELRR